MTSNKPTYLFTVSGYRFYEHPTQGDEAPMLIGFNKGYRCSGFWDKPSAEDVTDLIGDLEESQMARGAAIMPSDAATSQEAAQ